jgi:ribose-phosphate pyrophosphokinase
MVFVHPVLSHPGAEILSKLPVTEFITTDTIPIPAEKAMHFGDRLRILSVSRLLGEVILRANEGRSVGALFNE